MGLSSVTVEISPGELVDKITILTIKSEKLKNNNKLRNVRKLDVRVLFSNAKTKHMETFSGGALNILIPIKSAVILGIRNIRKTTTIRDTKNILKVLLNRAATNSAVQVVLINNLQIMESLGKKYKMIKVQSYTFLF